MIHPKTRLQYIDDHIGYGVFAVESIPAGTIVYVKDSLEIEITPEEFRTMEPEMKRIAEKYSYIDERGVRIVSWDFAKFVNHCCQGNTMSTGYGFEIAIRDIAAGEQITDEYGIFNLESDMEVSCDQPGCRRYIRNTDFDRYYREWDGKIRPALASVFDVEQPLFSLIDDATMEALIDFVQDSGTYRSVYELRYHRASSSAGNSTHSKRAMES